MTMMIDVDDDDELETLYVMPWLVIDCLMLGIMMQLDLYFLVHHH